MGSLCCTTEKDERDYDLEKELESSRAKMNRYKKFNSRQNTRQRAIPKRKLTESTQGTDDLFEPLKQKADKSTKSSKSNQVLNAPDQNDRFWDEHWCAYVSSLKNPNKQLQKTKYYQPPPEHPTHNHEYNKDRAKFIYQEWVASLQED